jgi:hypothetical protein
MRDLLPSGDGKNDKSTTRNQKKLMASKPRRCEFLLIIIFVISQMHVSLLEKRGAWVWLSRCGLATSQ